jgi:hypothetical protein
LFAGRRLRCLVFRRIPTSTAVTPLHSSIDTLLTQDISSARRSGVVRAEMIASRFGVLGAYKRGDTSGGRSCSSVHGGQYILTGCANFGCALCSTSNRRHTSVATVTLCSTIQIICVRTVRLLAPALLALGLAVLRCDRLGGQGIVGARQRRSEVRSAGYAVALILLGEVRTHHFHPLVPRHVDIALAGRKLAADGINRTVQLLCQTYRMFPE